MLSLLISFFGYIVSIRLFSALFFRFNLKKNFLHGIFYLLLIFDLFVIILSFSPPFICLWHVFLFLTILLSPRWVEVHLERSLRDYCVFFLDQVILSVQVGSSLRNSIKTVAEQEKGWKHYELMKAHAALFLSEESAQLRSPVLKELFEELKWIDSSRVRTLEQLKSLRWHHHVQLEFRRKSGQVAQQTRIQAVVVSILYVALLAFNIAHFGFFENLQLLTMSAVFFVIGLILIFLLGRRIKWKV